MIKRTMLVVGGIFVLYLIGIQWLPHRLNTQQHLWNSNFIKAENYLFSTEELPNECVIVGSSLSARLIQDSLPPLFVNLAMGSQSLFDGLHLVQQRPRKPVAVFIEINAVLREKNKAFAEALFSPAGYYGKRFVPALRTQYQPVGVLKGLLVNTLKNSEETQPSAEEDPSASLVTDAEERLLSKKRTLAAEPPNKAELDYAFRTLHALVDELESHQIKIVFFEVPIKYEWQALARPSTIRERFTAEFPPEKFPYIQLPRQAVYQTTDGLHLNVSSASRFTSYFRQKTDSLRQEGNLFSLW